MELDTNPAYTKVGSSRVRIVWIAIIAICVGAVLVRFLGGAETPSNYFVEQYEKAKAPEEQCVYAGLAANFYLDQNNLEEFQIWSAKEARDCDYARSIK